MNVAGVRKELDDLKTDAEDATRYLTESLRQTVIAGRKWKRSKSTSDGDRLAKCVLPLAQDIKKTVEAYRHYVRTTEELLRALDQSVRL